MPSYYQRQNRRFNNTVKEVRRNPYATAIQHALGINDASTRRQLSRAGAYVRKNVSSQYESPMTAQSLSGQGNYRVKTAYGNHIKPSHGHADTYKRRQYGAMNKAANVTKLEKGEMRIVHSEYIGDLISSGTTGTTNFVSQSYGINPGNSGTFPWLSSTAINFQDYKFKKLVFEYRPLVSESTATTAATLTSMGAVIMATQYDSTQGAYTTKSIMENADYTVSAKPSSKMVHAIECKPKFNPLGTLYVSGSQGLSNSGLTNDDIRMQNLGIFQVASSNIPIAGSTALDLGEIWVHYDIELYKPQLNAGLSNLLSGHWVNSAATGSQATTTPFGPNVAALIQPTQKTGSLLQCTFSASGIITFPLSVTEGNYMVVYSCLGSGATLNASGFAAVQACTLLTVFSNSSVPDYATNFIAPQSGLGSVSDFACGCIVSVNAPGSQLAQIQLNTVVIPNAGGYDIFITPINSNIIS